MKGQFLGIVAVLLALPNESAAQLAPPNAAGLAFSHVHLNVADVELHKTLWSELFEGRVIEHAGHVAISVPGTLIFLDDRAPTAPSVGTAVNHVGFKVQDLSSTLSMWRSWGYEVDAEFMGGEGLPQAYITLPNGTRVELTGDPHLTRSAEMHHVHFYSPDREDLLGWWCDENGGDDR